jgi:hypothetical protein
MFVSSTLYDLTIVFDMCNTTFYNKHNDFYIIGDIHRREVLEIGIPSEPIAF